MNKFFLILLVVITALILFNYIIVKFDYVLGERIEPENFTNQIDYLPQPGNYLENPTYKQHINIIKNKNLDEYDNGPLINDNIDFGGEISNSTKTDYNPIFSQEKEMINLSFNKNILKPLRETLIDKEILNLNNAELKYNFLDFLFNNQSNISKIKNISSIDKINALDLFNNLTYLKNEDINKIPSILELFTWSKTAILTIINKKMILEDESNQHHKFKLFKGIESHHFKIEYIDLKHDNNNENNNDNNNENYDSLEGYKNYKSFEGFEDTKTNNTKPEFDQYLENKKIKTIDNLIDELKMTDEEMRLENLKQAKLFIVDKENLNPQQYPKNNVIFHKGDKQFGDFQSEDKSQLDYIPNKSFNEPLLKSNVSIENNYNKNSSYIKFRIYFTMKLYRKYSNNFFTVQVYMDINIKPIVENDKLFEYDISSNILKIKNLKNYNISFVLKRLVLVGGGYSNLLNKNINDKINNDIRGVTMTEFVNPKSAPYKQSGIIDNVAELKFKSYLEYNKFNDDDLKFIESEKNINYNENNYLTPSNVNKYGNELQFKENLRNRKIKFPYDETKMKYNTKINLAEINDNLLGNYDKNTFGDYKCYNIKNGQVIDINDKSNGIKMSAFTEHQCESYNNELGRNNVWDKPCKTNSDCPFYKANKNYSNDFGKCNVSTGKCEMPVGITPMIYTKYDKNSKAKCYNCPPGFPDNKCCHIQKKLISNGQSNLKSPDYMFLGDSEQRTLNNL